MNIFSWIADRFRTRATTEEINEALNAEHLPENTDISELLNNEQLLFQFIMRRWINDMEQRPQSSSNNNDSATTNTTATNDANENHDNNETNNERNDNNSNNEEVPEIPILNEEDVTQALREQLRETQRSSILIRFIDFIGVTLFPMLFFRVLKNVFSFISFSDDILEDTDTFLIYLQEHSFESLRRTQNLQEILPRSNSLVFKFAQIVHEELSYYFVNPSPTLARYLTLLCFFLYTFITSLFMMVSFIFLLLCASYTCGRRWGYIDKFLVIVTRESNGVF